MFMGRNLMQIESILLLVPIRDSILALRAHAKRAPHRVAQMAIIRAVLTISPSFPGNKNWAQYIVGKSKADATPITIADRFSPCPKRPL